MGGCEVDDGSGMSCSYNSILIPPDPVPIFNPAVFFTQKNEGEIYRSYLTPTFIYSFIVIDSFLQNFLHAGDHVHLGPGVTATRKTNPAVDLHRLPRIDLICLSHYHA